VPVKADGRRIVRLNSRVENTEGEWQQYSSLHVTHEVCSCCHITTVSALHVYYFISREWKGREGKGME
jgi:hypothetical protein